MEDGELVFIATPLMGHLKAQLELGRYLLAQFPQISIAVLIPKFPVPDVKIDAYLRSSPVNESQISLIEIPPLEAPPEAPELRSKSPFLFLETLKSLYKPVVMRVVATRRRRTLGVLTDMLLSQFVDVAEDLGVPSYVFFASGANTLAMMLELESRGVHAPSDFGELPPDSAPVGFPGFRNPVPLKVWPEIILHKENFAQLLIDAGRFRKSKGILLNSFTELECDILRSLSGDDRNPPIYTVGPMLHRTVRDADDPVFDCLNAQPPCSVVFLCFGSEGSFGKEQVEQIATGIELSGHRFLWSLRRSPNPAKGERTPSDFDDFEEILPVGFLEKTRGVGKVIGWAPQTGVLAHPSVGTFVSHCGWNSVLESVSFGVPVVTWPIYGEQQLNAFFLVEELGMAVELRMDYRCNIWERKPNMVVMATEVERGIWKAMGEEEGAAVRKKVKEMSEFAKKALDVGGSSHKSIHRFAQDLIKNLS